MAFSTTGHRPALRSPRANQHHNRNLPGRVTSREIPLPRSTLTWSSARLFVTYGPVRARQRSRRPLSRRFLEVSSFRGPYFRKDPLAEEVGFEPTVGCPTHDFQSWRFGRSRTPPVLPVSLVEMITGSQGYPSRARWRDASLFTPRSKAVVGSRATAVREPSQGWKPAALSGLCWVPRIA